MKSEVSTQRDGNTKPEPDTNTNLNLNPVNDAVGADTPAHDDGSPDRQQKTPITDARLRANRQNAQKSTGPRTVRGKATSRGNAMKHGLLSNPILYNPTGGAPINDEFHDLNGRLQEKYGKDDIRTQLLTETVVVECWRQRKALAIEAKCLENASHFGSTGYMSNLQRYRTSSQRALENSFDLLEQQSVSKPAGDEDESESDDSTSDAKNTLHRRQPTSGLTIVSATPAMPAANSEPESETVSAEALRLPLK